MVSTEHTDEAERLIFDFLEKNEGTVFGRCFFSEYSFPDAFGVASEAILSFVVRLFNDV